MRPFDYERATDVAQAVTLVAERPEARFLGGGTNLVDLVRRGVETPDRLIDVTGLPLTEVEATQDGGVRVGAVVTTRYCLKPSWPARRDSCAPWRPSAATSSSGPAARTSPT